MQREDELKSQVILFENLGNKLIGALAFGNKHPKNISLITDAYSELFKTELEKENQKEPQSVDKMIENMRSWGSRNSRTK